MLSLHNVGFLQGTTYYQKDDGYYTKSDSLSFSAWGGKLAQQFGLLGPVNAESFQNVLAGRGPYGENLNLPRGPGLISPGDLPKPLTSEQLKELSEKISLTLEKMSLADSVKASIQDHVMSKLDGRAPTSEKIKGILRSTENLLKKLEVSGEDRSFLKAEIQSNLKSHEVFERRSALDMTWSVPKSVSIEALVFQKQDVIEACREAVNYTLKFIENDYSHFREGSRNNRVVSLSDKALFAMFEHHTSRSLDPNFHYHVLVANFVPDSQGRFKAHHIEEIYRDSKLLGLVFQNRLARNLQELKYSIEIQSNSTFEIKDFSKGQRDIFSKRRNQLDEMGVTTQKQAREKVLINRPAKTQEPSRAELVDRWLKEGEALNLQPAERLTIDPNAPVDYAKAVALAVKELSEKESSFRLKDVERVVLENHLGRIDYDELKKSIRNELGKTVFESVRHDHFLSKELLEVENSYRNLAKEGMGKFSPLMNSEVANKFIAELEMKASEAGKPLNEGQRDALRNFLTSSDYVSAWQGVAGAGKSHILGYVASLAESRGFTVRGFGPSASSAQSLQDGSHIPSKTIASLLTNPSQEFGSKPLWVIDEASMLGSRDALSVLSLAKKNGAKVLLVGDVNQLSSVSAGAPFRELVAQLPTSYLSQSVRQQTEDLKIAVEHMNKGSIKNGLIALEKNIVSLGKEDTVDRISSTFLALSAEDRASTLILSRTNLERHETTRKIRDGLYARGLLGESRIMKTFEKIDLPAEKLKYASSTERGDLLVPNKSYRDSGLVKDQAYIVIEKDTYRNRLTVHPELNPKESITIKLTDNSNFSLFRPSEMSIAAGDKMIWTRNIKSEGRTNGENYFVKSIENSCMTIVDKEGQEKTLKLDDRFYTASGWVSTFHRAQGLTSKNVIASFDHGSKSEEIYVGVTRATTSITIYTEDKSKLFRQSEISGANKTATEMLKTIQKDKLNEDISPNFYANEFKDKDLSRDAEIKYGNRDHKPSEVKIHPSVDR